MGEEHRPPSFFPTHLRNLQASNECQELSIEDVEKTADTGDEVDSREEISADDALDIARRFHECSAVVGIHPDQAAGHIVEYAVASRKPFVVVPCCVYAS